MSTTISLDEEVRLYSTNAEREKYSTLATLFGIIISLDYLERAYVRDSITAAECVFLVFCFCLRTERFQYLKRYSPACTRLLSQYKTMLKLLGSDVPGVDEFMKRYRVSSGQKSHCIPLSLF
jgi:ESCRT-I complex subunit VPS28